MDAASPPPTETTAGPPPLRTAASPAAAPVDKAFVPTQPDTSAAASQVVYIAGQAGEPATGLNGVLIPESDVAQIASPSRPHDAASRPPAADLVGSAAAPQKDDPPANEALGPGVTSFEEEKENMDVDEPDSPANKEGGDANPASAAGPTRSANPDVDAAVDVEMKPQVGQDAIQPNALGLSIEGFMSQPIGVDKSSTSSATPATPASRSLRPRRSLRVSADIKSSFSPGPSKPKPQQQKQPLLAATSPAGTSIATSRPRRTTAATAAIAVTAPPPPLLPSQSQKKSTPTQATSSSRRTSLAKRSGLATQFSIAAPTGRTIKTASTPSTAAAAAPRKEGRDEPSVSSLLSLMERILSPRPNELKRKASLLGGGGAEVPSRVPAKPIDSSSGGRLLTSFASYFSPSHSTNGSANKLHRRRSSQQPVASTSAPREPTEEELMTPEDRERRAVLMEKQRALEKVMDEHDSLVREVFHMEKWTDMIAYNPEEAKKDASSVFLQWRMPYDLLAKTAIGSSDAPGGGRTTRRAISSRKESLALLVPPAPPPLPAFSSSSSTPAFDRKGKGKARASLPFDDEAEVPSPVPFSRRLHAGPPGFRRPPRASSLTPPLRNGAGASSSGSMPPPPVPIKRPNGTRPYPSSFSSASLAAVASSMERSNASPSSSSFYFDSDSPNPKRLKVVHRRIGPPPPPTYTHPSQVPPPPSAPSPRLYLESFTLAPGLAAHPDTPVILDDATRARLDELARHEAWLRRRIEELRIAGRLGGLDAAKGGGFLPEATFVRLSNALAASAAGAATGVGPAGLSSSHVAGNFPDADASARASHHAAPTVTQLVAVEPACLSRHSALLLHLPHVRRNVLALGKEPVAGTKKIARMIAAHWERDRGKEERAQRELEKLRRLGARNVAKAVRAKWKVAVEVVRARLKEAEAMERERLGKEALDLMLQRSSALLGQRRSEFAGGETPQSDDEDDVREGDQAEADIDDGEEVSDDEEEEEEEEEEEKEEDGEEEEEEESDEEADEEEDEAEELMDLETEAVVGMLLDDDLEVSIDGESARGSDGSPSEAEEVEDEDEEPIAMEVDQEEVVEEEATVSPSAPATDSTAAISAAEPSAAPPPLAVSTSAGLLRPSRSRRLTQRRALSSTVTLPAASADDTPDPDADDVDFPVEVDADAAAGNDDAELEWAMEQEGADDDDDSEDEGLLADADVPIEELMRRYGYPGAGEAESEEQREDASGLAEEATEQEEARSPELAESKQEEDVDGKIQRVERSPSLGDGSSSDSNDSDDDSDDASDNELEDHRLALVGEDANTGTPDDDVDPVENGLAPGTKRIRTPFLFRGHLRPYQQAGLDWLASLDANETNGILADEMGLGKTIQTISLLAYLACEKGHWGPHLIIVPTSVILNWEMEFKKFFPGFKVLTYYGNVRERKEKRKGWNTENAFNVCITSYQLVLADQHIFRRKPWHYMILDEAHNVKNFRSQRWQTLLGFNCQRRLLLTGTPLQNNLMELWSLLYFLMPAGMQPEGATGFANHKEFSEWFSNPMDKAIEAGGQMSEEAKATITRLHTLLRPYLLRRLKADVEKQLPGKYEHVVYCRLAKRQRFLYDEFMARAETRASLLSGNFLSIANCLMQLRKVCNHPDLFEVRPIVTSFAMPRSVAADFEIQDLFIRRRLLADEGAEHVNLDLLGLNFVGREGSSSFIFEASSRLDGSRLLPLVTEIGTEQPSDPPRDTRTIDGWRRYQAHQLHLAKVQRWQHIAYLNRLRCNATAPSYSSQLVATVGQLGRQDHLLPLEVVERNRQSFLQRVDRVHALVHSYASRAANQSVLVSRFSVVPPAAVALDVARLALPMLDPAAHPTTLGNPEFDTLHHSAVAHQIAFPDASLLQYDCGKLQKLFEMLRSLKEGGHRVLLFTQMTKVLDILEIFLSHCGHRYLRLDGSTKIEERQILTERFNTDERIFCFIASSRSGGVGINLTGADTVFFFDSDWNPALDKQCQDRAHRIGQTREVHIYRFVSEHTIEENMLKKANQKRLLDDVVIQDGEFTTDYFGKMDWKEMLGDDLLGTLSRPTDPADLDARERARAKIIGVDQHPQRDIIRTVSKAQLERDLALAEDEDDRVAGAAALEELEVDRGDFGADEEGSEAVARAAMEAAELQQQQQQQEEEEEEEDDGIGSVDDYMLRWVEMDYNEWFVWF